MEVKVLNFKKMEVSGSTREEALKAAPFDIAGDATQAYKNWKEKQTGAITEAMTKQFMLDYLNKKVKCAAGVGYSITLDSASLDSRKRPYTIEDVKNEGTRKFKRDYQLLSDVDGHVISSGNATKAAAKNAAKEYYKNGGKEDVSIWVTMQVTEGEAIAARCRYTPSKGTHNGTYLVFGVER